MKSTKNYLLSLFVIVSIQTGCSSLPKEMKVPTQPLNSSAAVTADDAAIETAEKDKSLVAPGFLFSLKSTADKAVNGKYRVSFDGYLALPYNVTINTKNKTVSEIQTEVVNAYNVFFKSPNLVQFEFNEKKYWIEVQGLVQKSGRYLVDKKTSLDEIFMMASGLSTQNPPNYLKINGSGQTRFVNLKNYFAVGSTNKSIQWNGGESLFLQKELASGEGVENDISKVNIVGEVKNPGEYGIMKNQDLLQYIVRAGGPTNYADITKITLFRDEGNGIRSHKELDLNDLSSHIELKNDDTLIVSTSNPTQIERKITIAAQISNIVTSFLLIIITKGLL